MKIWRNLTFKLLLLTCLTLSFLTPSSARGNEVNLGFENGTEGWVVVASGAVLTATVVEGPRDLPAVGVPTLVSPTEGNKFFVFDMDNPSSAVVTKELSNILTLSLDVIYINVSTFQLYANDGNDLVLTLDIGNQWLRVDVLQPGAISTTLDVADIMFTLFDSNPEVDTQGALSGVWQTVSSPGSFSNGVLRMITVNTDGFLVVGLDNLSITRIPEEAPRPDFIFINNPDDNTYRARINSDGKSLICSAGKYQYGLPGDIVDVTFNDVIYQLFVDGNLAGSITADASSASWDISEVTAKGLATCSISLGFNGARLSDSSDSNRNIFNAASLTKEIQHRSARSLESRKLQDALNALIKARSEIRSAFESQRLALNSSYENTIQELKSALESGKITSKQYTPGVRAANAEYREKLLPLSNSYQSSLTENTNGPTAANSESQSQLLEALKAIDASFAETLEKVGYGVVLN